MEKNYIVYQITNKINDKIYIGCHVTENIDDNYMGSGTNIKKALKEFGKENFDKIILHNFNNEKDMLEKEEQLVNKEFIARKDTYNIIVGGNQFLTTDTVTVKDKNGKTYQAHKNDPRYLSGELKHVKNGKTYIYDENNNILLVDINDKKYLSGEYKSVSKNTILVKDKNNKKFRISKNDKRWINYDLYGHTKNMIVVKNNKGIYLQVDKNDPRYLSGELKPIWLGKKHTEETKKKIGKANSIKQKGQNNSQYGTCWIYNEKINENRKIKKEDLNIWLKKGWNKGRKMNKKPITNNYSL